MAAGKLLPFRRRETKPSTTLPTAAASPQPAEAMSDEALLAACAVGDAAALAGLFDRHGRLMFRFLSRVVSADPCDVEDLAQMTFLEIWRGARGFRGKGSAKSWMLGVAANLARHHVRGEIRRRRAMVGLAERPGGIGPRPDIAAERSELVGKLAIALGTLPHDLRIAFVMCEIEEVPGVDAARALGLRPGTLWRRLHEARRALRDSLDGGSS